MKRISRGELLDGVGQPAFELTPGEPEPRRPHRKTGAKAKVVPVGADREPDPSRFGVLIIAVDPANACGWSAWRDGVLLDSGVVESTERQGGVRGVDCPEVYRVFTRLRKKWSPDAPGVMVAESQHPLPDMAPKAGEGGEGEGDAGKGKEKAQAVRMRGLEALMRCVEARQTWEAYSLLFGWTICRVHPASWTYAMLGRTRTMKRPELKERSLAYARSLGARPKDDNESDSVAIGHWYVTGGNPPSKDGTSAIRKRKRG